MGQAVFKNGGRKAAKPKVRTEQYEVRCVKTARDSRDLAGETGILTVDFVDDAPDEVTFDPDDETLPNAILPVGSLLHSGTAFALRTEDGHRWTFEETAEDYGDEPIAGDGEEETQDGGEEDEDE
jgi:hypothetical protein